MYTVGDALQLEVFKGCRVVAGQEGLKRPIRWAHAIDVPDAPNWLRGGELVLTTALSLAKDTATRQGFVRALDAKNVAGLLISVGEFIERVPPEMISVADELGLPIIEAPWEVHLVDVSEPINSRIVNQQFVLLQRASRIHRMLTQLVLDGGGLPELARTLAELVERAVTIESPDFQLLAYAEWGQTDQAREENISQMRTPPALIAELERRGDLAQLRAARQPIHIAPTPAAGMTMERIIAPIVVGSEVYGYTWLIADARPLGELDRMAIESAATIAALIMLREQTIQETENRLKGDFLVRLLQGSFEDGGALLYQGEQFSLDFHQPQQVLVIGRGAACDASPSELMRQMLSRAADHKIWMGPFGNEIVAVVEQHASNVQTLARKFAAIHPDVWIGIGRAMEDPLSLRLGYDQAREAMEIARQVRREQRILSFEDLGYLHLLYHAPVDDASYDIFSQKVQQLAAQGRSKELLATLETYLRHGGNALETARQLHIHRSTLIYRLQRIETLCNLDLSDPQVRINLQISIQLYYLRRERSQGIA
ncbi:MAG: PucR family transcriptional regulator [Chloroflexota bacterium]